MLLPYHRYRCLLIDSEMCKRDELSRMMLTPAAREPAVRTAAFCRYLRSAAYSLAVLVVSCADGSMLLPTIATAAYSSIV